MIEPEKSIGLVIPAKAGIQQQKTLREADKHSVLSLRGLLNQLDSRFRGNDDVWG